tara:strand:+ start:11483 stop:12043 length:561 start_codon:yes stop_codon:yes gene_type:complete
MSNDNYLRTGSIIAVVSLMLLSPAISDILNNEAAKYVNDNESSHNGLPTEWDNKQVICVYFPVEYPHSEYSSGVTMIDSDGSEIGINDALNSTGACVGGFDGFNEGLEFMMDATRVTGGQLSVGYTIDPNWGPFVHTIGGLNIDEVKGDFGGVYWSLLHNGEYSMVGIGDLVLSEGDVITWEIATW